MDGDLLTKVVVRGVAKWGPDGDTCLHRIELYGVGGSNPRRVLLVVYMVTVGYAVMAKFNLSHTFQNNYFTLSPNPKNTKNEYFQ